VLYQLRSSQRTYVRSSKSNPDLDTAYVKNYHPISNLTVLSKLLEKLVARQLIDYLSVNKLLPDRQSAYRAFRSTETAIAGLMSDILLALDAGDIAALALLDLSAAFNTVDHTILIQRVNFIWSERRRPVVVSLVSEPASAARVTAASSRHHRPSSSSTCRRRP